MKLFTIKTIISAAALGGAMVSQSYAADVRVLNWKGWRTDAEWAVDAFE